MRKMLNNPDFKRSFTDRLYSGVAVGALAVGCAVGVGVNLISDDTRATAEQMCPQTTCQKSNPSESDYQLSQITGTETPTAKELNFMQAEATKHNNSIIKTEAEFALGSAGLILLGCLVGAAADTRKARIEV